MQSPIKYLQFNWITEKTKHYQTAERIFWKLMLTSKLNTLVCLFAIFRQTGEYFAVKSPFPVKNCKFYIYPSAIELWGIFVVPHPLWQGTYILIVFPSVLQFIATTCFHDLGMSSREFKYSTSACYANYLTNCTTVVAPLPWSLILSVTLLHGMQAWNMSSTILQFQRSNDTLKIYIETCAHKFCALILWNIQYRVLPIRRQNVVCC